jgi:palmitoyl-protein thioesterase
MHLLWNLLAATTAAFALPQTWTEDTPERLYNASVRPVVVWHGMGDSYAAEGMQSFADEIRDLHPGIFVHLVHLADKMEDDQRAGFVSV